MTIGGFISPHGHQLVLVGPVGTFRDELGRTGPRRPLLRVVQGTVGVAPVPENLDADVRLGSSFRQALGDVHFVRLPGDDARGPSVHHDSSPRRPGSRGLGGTGALRAGASGEPSADTPPSPRRMPGPVAPSRRATGCAAPRSPGRPCRRPRCRTCRAGTRSPGQGASRRSRPRASPRSCPRGAARDRARSGASTGRPTTRTRCPTQRGCPFTEIAQRRGCSRHRCTSPVGTVSISNR